MAKTYKISRNVHWRDVQASRNVIFVATTITGKGVYDAGTFYEQFLISKL